jgi:hypothetical protein
MVADVCDRRRLSLGGRPRVPITAFCIAFAGASIVAMLQAPKPFHDDSLLYWSLGGSFFKHGHFSLLNYHEVKRGYALPLMYHVLQSVDHHLAWSSSSTVKLFNAAIFALIGAVLAPKLAEIVWPRQRWGLARRLALTTMLLVGWSGYLNFSLSDFPGLAVALLALVAVARPDRPGSMLLAGLALGLTVDIRAAYLPLVPALLVLVAWAWFEQRGGRHASGARRALCMALLLAGFAAVSLPQSLAEHRYAGTWSFVPHATKPDLTIGLAYQRFDAYVGPRKGCTRVPYYEKGFLPYADEAGLRLLREQKTRNISAAQYLRVLVGHPLAMAELLSRHVINGLDMRYSTLYPEHLNFASWPHVLMRLAGFLLIYLALVRVLWPTARRHLSPTRWRYLAALLLCCVGGVITGVQTRYMLPVFLPSYIMILAGGWPNPIAAAQTVPRRFRTTLILAGACLAFLIVVWHVVESASNHMAICGLPVG